MTEQNEGQTWTLSVDEDGVLTLPDELWETLGWQEGDELEFVENNDGSIFIVKVDELDNTAGTADS